VRQTASGDAGIVRVRRVRGTSRYSAS